MRGPTGILARWSEGFVYVGSGPREQYVELGGVTEEATAKALAKMILDSADLVETTQTDTGYQHLGNVAYSLLDTIGGGMVMSTNVRLEGEDAIVVSPGIAGAATLKLDAQERKLQRAAKGVNSQWGTPEYTRPDKGNDVPTTPPPISVDGQIKVRYSPIWQAPKPWWGTWLDCLVVDAGWATTRIVVAKVFSTGAVFPIATASIAGGKKRAIARINHGWQRGEKLICYCSEAGGAKQLTISLRGAMS